MNYSSMLTNIVSVINYLCVEGYFYINIYRYNNDIKIEIANKKNNLIIYQKEFKNLKNEYNYLINDLINIFCDKDVTISKLIKTNNTLFQQSICSNNLEFTFDINANNYIEIKKAALRHYNFNNAAQNGKLLKKQKTNHSTSVIAG